MSTILAGLALGIMFVAIISGDLRILFLSCAAWAAAFTIARWHP